MLNPYRGHTSKSCNRIAPAVSVFWSYDGLNQRDVESRLRMKRDD